MKKVLERITSWVLIVTMLLGGNTLTVFAEEITDVGDSAAESFFASEDMIIPSDINIGSSQEPENENTETDVSQEIVPEIPAEDTYNTDDPEDLQETESDADAELFTYGYVRLFPGSVVYKSSDTEEQLGTADTESVVYACETFYDENGFIKWFEVMFDSEDGVSCQGYVKGQSAVIVGDEEAADISAEINGNRFFNGILIPIISFKVQKDESEDLTEGLWVYEIRDNYAAVLGYLDYNVTDLSIPDQLGGYYVNSIGSKAFEKNTALSNLYIHGNVISIADDAFSSNGVTLSGYNGTEALRFAEDHGMTSVNKTNVEHFEFQKYVIDFSYSDSSRYSYLDGSTIQMCPAEAAQLSYGSIFYIPKVYDDLVSIWKVENISVSDNWATISVSEASPEESLTRFSVQDEALTADWSQAEWAEGVELIEEKWSSTFDGSVNLKFEQPLSKKNSNGKADLNFFIEGKLGLKATASLDYEIHLFRDNVLNEASLIVEPSATIKSGIKYSKDFGNKDKNTYTKAQMPAKDGQDYEFYLGSVPLISAAKVIEVKVALYAKISVTGEITITVKGAGKIGTKWNKDKNCWESVNTWSWDKPTISGSVNLTVGPAQAVELHCAVFGKVLSLEAFEGITVDFTVNTNLSGGSHDATTGSTSEKDLGDTCFNLKVEAKLSLTLKLELDVLKDLMKKLNLSSKAGYSWELLALKKKIGEWHYEIGRGLLDKCTYDNTFTVDFYTGTSEKVESQKVRGGAKATAPELKKLVGTFIGWYTDKNFTTEWNFSENTVKKNTTLYAKWDIQYKTVTYKVNYTGSGGEIKDFTESVIPGETIKEPAELLWMDHKLEGWYKDEGFTEKWNFSSDKMPDSDLTLYANWEDKPGYDPYAVNVGQTGGGNISFQGHTYLHIKEYKSYSEAAAYAKKLGGYLATINSEQEQQFLAEYLYKDCAQKYLWLGMNSTGKWSHWATGEKIVYTNWNSAPVTSSSQYNGALIRTSGKWTTLSNSETAHFVIEWGDPVVDADYIPEEEPDVQYIVDTSAGTASVTGWNNDVEKLTIDSYFEGYPVTSIVAKAFQNNTALTEIEIPSTVTSIGSYAFAGCVNLKEAVIPNSVVSVGEYVFNGCTGLTSVKWSANTPVIPRYAFYGASSLVSVEAISSVETIGEKAFYNCKNLLSIRFPSVLTDIGGYAFYSCYSLPNINLPESVVNIGANAFYSCTGAVSITVTEKMTKIPNYAFYNCKNVQTVNIPSGITAIGSSAFNNVNGTYYLYRGTAAETWAVKNKKNISYLGASYRVEFYSEVNGSSADGTVSDIYIDVGQRIPEPTVKRKGYDLEGWYLDTGFTQKWDFAAKKMPEHNVTLYAKWIEASASFDYTVSNGTATITRYNGNNSDVTIPSVLGGYKVATLADESFVSKTIRSITIPETVSLITPGAFDCPNLYTIKLVGNNYYSVHDDGVLYIKSGKQLIYAPQGRSYSEYTVPDGVSMIRKRAFYGQKALRKVFIPDSVTSINAAAFEGVRFLTIYGSVDTCEAKTFAQRNGISYNLYNVNFYDGENLLYTALIQADALINDYYQPVTEKEKFTGWYRDPEFKTKWNFKTDKMPKSDLNLYIKWNSLFSVTVNGSSAVITGYNGTASDIVIPDEVDGYTVTGIASGAFTNAKYASVTVPDGVISIASGAFHNKITVYASEDSAAKKYAENNGIKYSKRKYTVYFEELGGSLVNDQKAAPGDKIKLPVPIRSSFYFAGWFTDTSFTDEWTNDTNMPDNDVTLYAYWKVADINNANGFSYNILEDGTIEIVRYLGDKISLTVPGTINGYTVTRIGSYAFKDNTDLLLVTLPDTVTSIGEYAFANTYVRTVKGAKNLSIIEEAAFLNASGLNSIALSTKLRTIGDFAFQGCSSLTEITFPKGTESIGYRAFYDCEYLDTVNITTTLSHIGSESFAKCPRLLSVSVPTALLAEAGRAFDSTVIINYKTSTNINILTSDVTDNTLKLTWNKVQGGVVYAVESKRTTNKTFQRKLETSETKASFALGAYDVTYDVKVVALDAGGNVICESPVIAIYLSRLETPTIKSVTQKSGSTAEMVLKAVKADGYEVERSNSLDGPFTLLKEVTAASFTNSGLIPGEDYFYRVRAFKKDESGVKTYSRYSEIYSFHMPFKFMESPTNVIVRQTSVNAAAISWDAVDEADGYLVYRSVNGGGFTQLRELTETSTVNTALPKNGVFSYKVCAYFYDGSERIIGTSSDVVMLTLQTVATPEITDITQKSASGIVLSWTPVKGASGYKLYKSDSKDGSLIWAKNITSGTAVSASYSNGLISGNTYFFAVRAYIQNEDGTLSYSNYSPAASIDFSSVAQVSGLTVAQSTGDKIKLTWSELTGIDGYEIWMSVSDQSHFEQAAVSKTGSVNIDSLNNGMTYYFKVRGYAGSGNSRVDGEFSEVVSTSVIGTPVLKVAEQNGTASARLIWSKIEGASGYEVWYKSGLGDYTLAKDLTANSTTLYSLVAGSNYSFKVRSYKLNEANKKEYGSYSNAMSAYILGTTKITSLVMSGGTAVTLTWEKVPGATGYDLYRCDTIDGVYKKIKTTTDLTISNSGLTKGSIYYYKIVPYKTVNGVQMDGRPTGAKSIRLLERPVLNSIEQTAATTLSLRWSEVPTATFYRVYRSDTPNGEFTLLKKVTGTAATSINLTANKWYYYKIEAGSDEDGATYYSQLSAAKGAYVTDLVKPVISTIEQTSETSLKFKWKKISGADGYEVLRADSEDAQFTPLKVLTAAEFVDTDLIAGKTYYYKVRPYTTVNNTKVYGVYSESVGALMMSAVKITAVERTENKRIDLYWEPVNGATSYNIYRSASKNGTYSLLKTSTDTTAYNSALTVGNTYYYKVAAVCSSGSINNIGVPSGISSITLANVGVTAITSVQQTDSASVKLSWKAVDGADGYEISVKQEGENTYSRVKTQAETTAATKAYLEDGKTFMYRVRAYVTVDGKKEYGAYSAPISISLMSVPAMDSLYQIAKNRVEMTWAEITGADGYEIYRKDNNGKYIKLKTSEAPSVTNTSLTLGTAYTYKVRAYSENDGIISYSGFSNEMTIIPIQYSSGNYPETEHNYSNKMDQTWSYTIEGAQALRAVFVDETMFENRYDKLYITDKEGNAVGSSYYTGSQLAGKTVIVPGDTINLRMTTDSSGVKYGFAFESIVPAGT